MIAGRQEKVSRKVCMHDMIAGSKRRFQGEVACMIAGRQEKVPRKVCMHDMIAGSKRRFQGKFACMTW